jgi:hypothetical protein
VFYENAFINEFVKNDVRVNVSGKEQTRPEIFPYPAVLLRIA